MLGRLATFAQSLGKDALAHAKHQGRERLRQATSDAESLVKNATSDVQKHLPLRVEDMTKPLPDLDTDATRVHLATEPALDGSDILHQAENMYARLAVLYNSECEPEDRVDAHVQITRESMLAALRLLASLTLWCVFKSDTAGIVYPAHGAVQMIQNVASLIKGEEEAEAEVIRSRVVSWSRCERAGIQNLSHCWVSGSLAWIGVP